MLVSAGVAFGALLVGGVSVSADEYTVEQGDTVWDIAQTNGTTVSDIEALNPAIDKTTHFIQIGDKLIVSNSGNTQQTDSYTNEQQVAIAPVVPQQVQQPVQEQPKQTVQAPVQQVAQEPEQQAPVVKSVDNSSAKNIIAQRESGGNYNAQNGIYQGKYQLTSSYLHGDFSPENQERVADQYVQSRYGGWDNALSFWNANGWY